MRKIADNMPQSDADKLVLFNLMPWPREEVINTTVRLRGSQFNLRDGRGQPVPYFIRHAREIDPGLIDRQIVHYGNYDPFMEFDIQISQIVPSMGYRTLYIEANQPGNVVTPKVKQREYWKMLSGKLHSMRMVHFVWLIKIVACAMTGCFKLKKVPMMGMNMIIRQQRRVGHYLSECETAIRYYS